jgi:hypothetical protein
MFFCAFSTFFATWMVVVVVCLVDGSYYSFRLGFLPGIGVCAIPSKFQPMYGKPAHHQTEVSHRAPM